MVSLVGRTTDRLLELLAAGVGDDGDLGAKPSTCSASGAGSSRG